MEAFRLVCFVWLSVFHFTGGLAGEGARYFPFFQLLLQGIAGALPSVLCSRNCR